MSSYDERNRRPGDDDGRTIADMSDLDRPKAFSFTIGDRSKQDRERDAMPPAKTEWQELNLSPKERFMLIAGALKASLLIALAFIVGLGLVTWLMLLFWT